MAKPTNKIEKGPTRITENIWFYLFAHHNKEQINRLIHFKIFSKDIYLCGRCTFKYIGIIITLLMMFFMGYTSQVLYKYPMLLFLGLFVFPVTSCFAWLYQYLTKNDNPRIIRYATGYMVGISKAFLFGCIIWLDLFLFFIFFSLNFLYIGVLAIIIYIKKEI